MQGPPGQPGPMYRPSFTPGQSTTIPSGMPQQPGQPSWTATSTTAPGGPRPVQQQQQTAQPPVGMMQQMKIGGPGPHQPPSQPGGAPVGVRPMAPQQTQMPRPSMSLPPAAAGGNIRPAGGAAPQGPRPPVVAANGHNTAAPMTQYPQQPRPPVPQQQQPRVGANTAALPAQGGVNYPIQPSGQQQPSSITRPMSQPVGPPRPLGAPSQFGSQVPSSSGIRPPAAAAGIGGVPMPPPSSGGSTPLARPTLPPLATPGQTPFARPPVHGTAPSQQQYPRPPSQVGALVGPPLMSGGPPMRPPLQQQQQQQQHYPGQGPFSPTVAAGSNTAMQPPTGPPPFSPISPGTAGLGWTTQGVGSSQPPPVGGPGLHGRPFSVPQPGMPGQQQQQQPGGGGFGQQPAPQSMSRSIDPGQMPRPSTKMPATQVFETRRENTHNVPPPTEDPIVVRDNGSAGPRYMRSTLNAIPASNDLLKAISLPFVVMINPLAMPKPGDTPVEIVDMGPSGPLRCKECKAYVNPHMRILDNGRRMSCCFCNTVTDIPPDAFSMPHAWQDQTANPALRPELSRGSVEFVATKEYMVRPPAPPTYMFVIDVSQPAIGSGATASVCASLAKLLDELPGGNRTRVGVITYDTSVHFYMIKPGGDRARMLVMADVEEPYNPLGNRATVSLSECKDQLETLISSIPTLFAATQIPENCAGAAVASAVSSLKADVGGRVILCLSSLPHKGALALNPREAGRPPTERDVLDIMEPRGKGYAALAADAAENQISIDVLALSQGYVDLATLSVLSTTTCGSVMRFTPFNPATDAATMHNDLRWALVRPQGLEAVGRVRVSTGMSVEKYVGSFYKRSLTDINLPAVHCDAAISARIIHDERLTEGSEVYIQFALLYTTTEGQRRVRVHTLAIPVTRSSGTAFRAADMDTYLSYVARKVSSQIPGRSLIACREAVAKAAVDTLVAYRKQCASASSSGQLILPEALKLLPLYTLALTKLPCFRTDARADNRAMWMARLLSLPADRIVSLVHPRLIPLTDLASIASVPEGENIKLPEKLPLSAEKLEPTGIYLLENGFEAYVYVGASATPDLCQQLLGLPNVEAMSVTKLPTLPVLENPINKAAHRLLNEIRRQRSRYLRLRVLKRGDQTEPAFLASLVEDKSPSAGVSYVEYLCHLHRQIQNKL